MSTAVGTLGRAAGSTALLNSAILLAMQGFDQRLVAATIQHLTHLLSEEGVEVLLQGGKPSRVAVADLTAVIAEYGHHITLPPRAPKTYLTLSEGEPAELYADVRLWVDGTPSDLVLRCTLFAELNRGHYAYRVEDLLAP